MMKFIFLTIFILLCTAIGCGGGDRAGIEAVNNLEESFPKPVQELTQGNHNANEGLHSPSILSAKDGICELDDGGAEVVQSVPNSESRMIKELIRGILDKANLITLKACISEVGLLGDLNLGLEYLKLVKGDVNIDLLEFQEKIERLKKAMPVASEGDLEILSIGINKTAFILLKARNELDFDKINSKFLSIEMHEKIDALCEMVGQIAGEVNKLKIIDGEEFDQVVNSINIIIFEILIEVRMVMSEIYVLNIRPLNDSSFDLKHIGLVKGKVGGYLFFIREGIKNLKREISVAGKNNPEILSDLLAGVNGIIYFLLEVKNESDPDKVNWKSPSIEMHEKIADLYGMASQLEIIIQGLYSEFIDELMAEAEVILFKINFLNLLLEVNREPLPGNIDSSKNALFLEIKNKAHGYILKFQGEIEKLKKGGSIAEINNLEFLSTKINEIISILWQAENVLHPAEVNLESPPIEIHKKIEVLYEVTNRIVKKINALKSINHSHDQAEAELANNLEITFYQSIQRLDQDDHNANLSPIMKKIMDVAKQISVEIMVLDVVRRESPNSDQRGIDSVIKKINMSLLEFQGSMMEFKEYILVSTENNIEVLSVEINKAISILWKARDALYPAEVDSDFLLIGMQEKIDALCEVTNQIIREMNELKNMTHFHDQAGTGPSQESSTADLANS
ncbi:hypothetical protein [Mycoavidus sp. B2-EB]|uniref:hypothetical protein n=1 Tax=Mycoavidus sp. B2-EB TaxID=2651972 RepID=UPI0016246EDA|nr:hypothetical protein [Mycoavidus sp. B2-EB]BBO59513.1 hypothetical protein MPB2EB_0633 [Mycoavidus sp. B2-EB]